MRIVMAGASGFLGRSWREHLARQGHDVVRLVRGPAESASESSWDPYAGRVDRAVVESADVVANVAGASFYRWPLTEKYKQAFAASRVQTTRVLAEAVAASERRPAFLAQNGSSYYGERGDEVLTEDSGPGDQSAFLHDITLEWEAATEPATQAGARVCVMRTGVVLDRRGGAFQLLQLVFRAGLGGPLGDGQQYFPTIALTDWVRAATFLAEHDECRGPYNLVAPDPSTNADFTKALGRMLHRPTVLRVPAAPVRKVFPELSPELFGSVRAQPARLLEAGFVFEHPSLDEQLAAALT